MGGEGGLRRQAGTSMGASKDVQEEVREAGGWGLGAGSGWGRGKWADINGLLCSPSLESAATWRDLVGLVPWSRWSGLECVSDEVELMDFKRVSGLGWGSSWGYTGGGSPPANGIAPLASGVKFEGGGHSLVPAGMQRLCLFGTKGVEPNICSRVFLVSMV